MICIDKYAYSSKLKHTDPMQKIVFALLTMTVCLWADSIIISTAVIFIMVGMTVLRGGTSIRLFMKLLLVPMSFLLIGVVTIAVNISDKPETMLTAFSVANTWIGVSNGGLKEASRLFFKALGAVSCLYFLSLSTPMVDLLVALRRLRVPKLLVELMELVYRSIFVMLETADNIYNAQKCRLGYSSLISGYCSLGSLISMLFIKSYKRSDELFTALESRGYEGDLNVLEEIYEKHWQGYFLAILINIILVLSAIFVKQA